MSELKPEVAAYERKKKMGTSGECVFCCVMGRLRLV